jgi:hypothetical protein
MRALRWWSLFLVPGGFVAGHELGYQAATAIGASPAAAGAHGYLGALVLVGAPFAFAAVARSLLAGYRDELRPVRWSTLAGAQATLFLAVEMVEHLHAGLSPAQTLAEPAVVLGLVAQLAVAAVLTLVAGSSHEAAAAFAARRRRVPTPPKPRLWLVAPGVPTPAVVPVSSLSRRGPPRSPVI